jgi:hypothetical protein
MSRLSTIIEERCTMSRPAIHPGEILAEACGFGSDADRARASTQGAGEPDNANHPREAVDQRRYRVAPRILVRHQRPILAQSSKCIRHSRRRARIGRRDWTPPYAFRIRQKTSTMITREKSTRTPATGAPLRRIGAEVAISRSAVVNAGANSQCMAAARSSAPNWSTKFSRIWD